MNIRSLVETTLPDSVVRTLRRGRRRYAEYRFLSQETISLQCGGYLLEAPESHALAHLLKIQPYRDGGISVSARYLGQKYPEASFVDVGANIGDTAALMASEARNTLILVEASDYFFSFLERNARKLPNKVRLEKVLIADGSQVSGQLYHWGGTAFFSEDKQGQAAATRRLCDVADSQTRFVKIDTDGYDFKILRSSIDWLSRQKPALFFEDQIRTEGDLAEAGALVHELESIGYSHFVVWDDPGYHLVSTSDARVLQQLHRYLYKVWQQSGAKSICNYDVLCLHRDDSDVFQSVSRWCDSY